MEAYAHAATETNNTVRTVQSWVKGESDGGVHALDSKRDRCGRKTAFSPRKQEKVDQVMKEKEGEVTLREVQQELGIGSHNTAKRYLELSGWERRRKRLKTLLTPEHAKDRMEYVEEHFDDDFQDTAFADEKLFVLGSRNWRYMKAEDGDTPCLQFVADKAHPPQLMVTAIVMPPLPAKDFNGKVALFMTCAEIKPAARNSKNRPAGTLEIKPVNESGTLDGEAYFKQLQSVAFPAIEAAGKKIGKRWTKFQDDNAPVHSWAWTPKSEWKGKKHAHRSGDDLDTVAKSYKIKRSHQPARSPDLNVLDLYVWRVLEKGVQKRRPKTLMELWTALNEAWEHDLTEAKIECAFRLMKPVMGLINDKQGYNNFTLPHSGIRAEMRADGWDI